MFRSKDEWAKVHGGPQEPVQAFLQLDQMLTQPFRPFHEKTKLSARKMKR